MTSRGEARPRGIVRQLPAPNSLICGSAKCCRKKPVLPNVDCRVFFCISGTYRGAELALFPQKRGALRHFDQGVMRRLDGITGGSVRPGGRMFERVLPSHIHAWMLSCSLSRCSGPLLTSRVVYALMSHALSTIRVSCSYGRWTCWYPPWKRSSSGSR